MQKRSILLINSSQVLMDITKKILERAGYSVRCAVGLAVARELLADFTRLLVEYYESGSPDAIAQFIYENCIDGMAFE